MGSPRMREQRLDGGSPNPEHVRGGRSAFGASPRNAALVVGV